jgi:hypothetical protein
LARRAQNASTQCATALSPLTADSAGGSVVVNVGS